MGGGGGGDGGGGVQVTLLLQFIMDLASDIENMSYFCQYINKIIALNRYLKYITMAVRDFHFILKDGSVMKLNLSNINIHFVSHNPHIFINSYIGVAPLKWDTGICSNTVFQNCYYGKYVY